MPGSRKSYCIPNTRRLAGPNDPKKEGHTTTPMVISKYIVVAPISRLWKSTCKRATELKFIIEFKFSGKVINMNQLGKVPYLRKDHLRCEYPMIQMDDLEWDR